jgi:hypothetical protein
MADPSDRIPDGADQRLQQLTEQSLHLLDELAAARAALRAAEVGAGEGRARCQQLEDQLAELQRHVRRSRTSRLVVAPADAAPATMDTFLWVSLATPAVERDRWLMGAGEWLAAAAATLVCPAGQQPPAAVLSRLPHLRILESDGGQPAQVWNLIVATATAPAVLVLGPGARPRTLAALQPLAAIADPAVAMVQPVLTFGGKHAALGLTQSDDLRVQRQPLPSARDTMELDALAPEAFVLRRAACAALGPFDEDLVGAGALHEYSVRARAAGYRLVGVPDVAVDVPARQRLLDATVHERDRLVILARHRPQELYSALATFRTFWTMPETELRAWLRALLLRLPSGQTSPAAIDLLAGEATALVRHAVPASLVTAHLERLQEVLSDASGHAERDEVSDVAGAPHGKAPALTEQTAQSMHAARMHAATRMAELKSATAALAALAGAKQEVERAGHAERQRWATEREQLESERQRLEAEVHRLRAQLSEQSAQLARGATALAELQAEVAAVARAREQAEARLAAAGEFLAQTAAAAGSPGQAPAELHQVVAQLRQQLTDRERWVVALLEEKGRRRLKLRAGLLEHEQRFLAQQRATRRS